MSFQYPEFYKFHCKDSDPSHLPGQGPRQNGCPHAVRAGMRQPAGCHARKRTARPASCARPAHGTV
ncbi:hypothetical protein DESPIGER_0510 [Desulfovibrio piger]|uniref:Uncharacterized protein n=1 Tax=Desulfovibrio piger TaxID=901 RepID=A0A1K1LG16_9BACT|nr:hypothetical protein DESPIGER_0510 [Desulfovibrio piger]